jgi:SAM-dependent methyltransferase
MDDPISAFQYDGYRRHNSRRLEHLTSLGLPLAGRQVLELGAGIGDHTGYFVDRGCRVTAVDGRAQNLAVLKARFAAVATVLHDLDDAEAPDLGRFDIVYAYGVLYHLVDPARALARIADWTQGMLLLETCVSFGADIAINPVGERIEDPTQSLHGRGCRPTRGWVFETLKGLFAHVYVPATQPWHEEFPLDWQQCDSDAALIRAIFIAARAPLDNPLLLRQLPQHQRRGP